MKTLSVIHAMRLLPILFMLLAMLAVNAWPAENNPGRNKVLLEALSPFEDLVECARLKDDNNLAALVQAVTQTYGRIQKMISAESSGKLALLVADITESSQMRKYDLIALQSIESYKVIALELDPAGLKAPLEVVMLDYIGFKIQVLAAMDQPDWLLLRNAVAEADSYWMAIEPTITDAGLHESCHTVIKGLSEALALRNREMLIFASRVELDLVDLLEEYFGSPQAPWAT